MAVSAELLQSMADDIYENCSRLSISFPPQGYIDPELTALAKSEGKTSQKLFEAERALVSERAQSCCVCHSAGIASTIADGEAAEADTLRFSTLWRVDFLTKLLVVHKGGFCCGRCRALSNVKQFVQFNALHVPSPSHPNSEQVVQGLQQHFAEVNALPRELRGNPDKFAAWMQELYSRAFALQVVASNIRGWGIAGPDRQRLQPGEPGTALALLRKLLEAETAATRKGAGAKKGRKAADSTQGLLHPEPRQAGTKKMRRSVEEAAVPSHSTDTPEGGAAQASRLSQAQQPTKAGRQRHGGGGGGGGQGQASDGSGAPAVASRPGPTATPTRTAKVHARQKPTPPALGPAARGQAGKLRKK